MATTGRKTVPAAIKHKAGELKKEDAGRLDEKAKTITGFFDAPESVKVQPYAEAAWNHTLPILMRMRVVTSGDIDALSTYCIAVGIHREATRSLAAKPGLYFESITEKGGTIQRKWPELDIINSQAKIIQSFAAEFGLTPSSRTKIAVTLKPEDDPLDEFITLN